MRACRILMNMASSTSEIKSLPFQPNVNNLIEKLDRISPRFEVNSNDIDIIQTPSDFYTSLKSKILTAKYRIFLSSLYIGKNQDALIDCIADSLQHNPSLKVHILTDALRGTREAPSKSSASLLATLMEKHPSQVEIRMYHTPHLNGFWRMLVPKRFNEGFGLQHMKIYGVDDELILSGANLSSDYFTNRQDRYYLFKSKGLSDYYFKIQESIGSLSYKLEHSTNESKFTLRWPKSNPVPEPKKTNLERFLVESSKILKDIFELQHQNESNIPSATKTYVYPVSQFTPLFKSDISTEKAAVLSILDYVDHEDSRWTFTAGYFNMLPEIKQKLLKSKSNGTVITASPFANGFYKSNGASGYLPEAYLHLSKLFLRDVARAGRSDAVMLREWKKGVVNTEGGWSYHAKGIWASSPGELKPSITIIGSSNYTRRAYNFDLESNAIIVTNDETLRTKMQQEVENIVKDTQKVTVEDFERDHDRQVSKGVILATKILGKRL